MKRRKFKQKPHIRKSKRGKKFRAGRGKYKRASTILGKRVDEITKQGLGPSRLKYTSGTISKAIKQFDILGREEKNGKDIMRDTIRVAALERKELKDALKKQGRLSSFKPSEELKKSIKTLETY